MFLYNLSELDSDSVFSVELNLYATFSLEIYLFGSVNQEKAQKNILTYFFQFLYNMHNIRSIDLPTSNILANLIVAHS